MSRTYEALKKVERERANGHAAGAPEEPAGAVPRRAADDPCALQYDRLRLWMLNQGDNSAGMRVVMVTGCRRGSGTTSTVTGLATALSEQPSTRVLMVDANLRAPGLGRLDPTDRARGLRDGRRPAAGDGALLIEDTRRPNLCLLPAGALARHPAAALDSAAVEALVADLRTRFDFVVFDTPPLLDFPDGYSLARHVDVVLLVVDAERTSLDDARRTTRDLERAGARRAAVVLNRQRDYMPRLLRRILGA